MEIAITITINRAISVHSVPAGNAHRRKMLFFRGTLEETAGNYSRLENADNVKTRTIVHKAQLEGG